MYDWPEFRSETERFWKRLSSQMRLVGLDAPEQVTFSNPGDDHWCSPDLYFSQTCGFPYITRLADRVNLIAAPSYDLEGCGHGTYRSAVVVRKDSDFSNLGQTGSAKFAYNGGDSLSGFRCLFPFVGNPESHFASSSRSGSHRASAKQVAEGKADIAAIDAVCWAMFQEVESVSANNLKVLCWTEAYPALPYICHRETSDDQIGKMRTALNRVIEEAEETSLHPAVCPRSVIQVQREDYEKLLALI